ncbi:MAG: hypothetical protein AB8G14_07415 [Ilumatobacter sp.]
MTNYTAINPAAANLRSATSRRIKSLASSDRHETSRANRSGSGRGGRYVALVGLAAAAAVSVVAFTAGGGTGPTSVELDVVTSGPAVELPGDLVVRGNVITRTYRPDVELPGDLAVSGLGPSGGETVVTVGERTAADATSRGPNVDLAPPSSSEAAGLAPTSVLLGRPVVMFGSVACVPFQHLGPNVDLAPDSTGQRSSGDDVLAALRQRGPNADLPFDPNGMRSSGNDPICVAS